MFGRLNQVMQLKSTGIYRRPVQNNRPVQSVAPVNYGPAPILPSGSTIMSLDNDGTLSVNKLKLGGNVIYLGKDGEIYVNDVKFLPEKKEEPKEEPKEEVEESAVPTSAPEESNTNVEDSSD